MNAFLDKLTSNKKNTVGYLLTLLLLVAIPLTVYTTLHLRQNAPKAAAPNKTMTPEQVAGMVGYIDESEAEFDYSFTYNKDSGKATLDSVKMVPHGDEAITTTTPGEVPFSVNFTDSKGNKTVKKNVLKANNSKFKIKTPYMKDGSLEITDNLGVVVYKEEVKNLPKAEGIPAQIFYEKMKVKYQ
ncbi:MAG TPA: hypothetical protein VLE47_00730 [Candidatus Saccharimonadales bacterium]|nr:hypothetical protein [Candidatus Saccharimonadales bacterium]